MSAESSLVFWGIRYEVPREEVRLLDRNSHPRITQARVAGLQSFGGNFGEPGERYFLFVGAKLGMIGGEYSAEIVLGERELLELIVKTNEKLRKGSFEGEPRLFVQWMPDA